MSEFIQQEASKCADEAIDHARRTLTSDQLLMYVMAMNLINRAIEPVPYAVWREIVATLNKSIVDFEKYARIHLNDPSSHT